MSDWTEDLTPEEREGWERIVHHAREDLVHKIHESSFVMSLCPSSGEVDVKFALETGFAIMLDKPIILISFPGQDIPPGLRRIAHEIIELEHDLDTEAGVEEMKRKFEGVAERWATDSS